MAYTKNVWTDQQVERPRTYTVTENQDNTITLQDAFGVATDLGTPVNATNMNHIEEGIEQCYTDLVQRKSTTTSTGNSTTPVYVDSAGKVQQCSRTIPVLGSLASNKTFTLTGAVSGTASVNLSSDNEVNISTNADNVFRYLDIDYSAPIVLAAKSNFGFTAASRGLLYVRFSSQDSAGYVKVNDNNVANGSTTGNNGETDSSAQIPLSVGDVVTRAGSGNAITTAIFYPVKGEV